MNVQIICKSNFPFGDNIWILSWILPLISFISHPFPLSSLSSLFPFPFHSSSLSSQSPHLSLLILFPSHPLAYIPHLSLTTSFIIHPPHLSPRFFLLIPVPFLFTSPSRIMPCPSSLVPLFSPLFPHLDPLTVQWARKVYAVRKVYAATLV
jgi:hypothetical protein